MNKKWLFSGLLLSVILFLGGCEPVTVLDPKGPQAALLKDVIMISIWTMLFVVVVVFVLLIYILVKYRSTKTASDYRPPIIKGNIWVEITTIGIPVLIIVFLSFVSVQSTYQAESVPEGFKDQEPMVIYASSSNWKWHFSYPEQDIETLNYLYIPTDRPIEFRLYSFDAISSFWIPQLGGQKYAMTGMLTKLNLAATEEAEMWGRNSNFSGEGFAEQTFNVNAVSQGEFNEWVEEVQETAEPIDEETFDELLEPGHLGQKTFTGTHLEFDPAPEEHGDHGDMNKEEMNEEDMEHSEH
ncbi:cytochrome aa3 quinol oxidase subunit II [Salimicrobium halophilum]|uniref:Quinol oxidase subunit 2 n=1 Tax=Salimicrobium halophilum TaxID=86666 RepID=A0A1G8TVG2_9BACI|nr:cytochrome aa3 quinol oxidase subunit II [Salimicrobium halophilum]SDJ45384.1 cytochrome aa3 quinol oxidase subunit 2 [Salimicrobium halophilum]